MINVHRIEDGARMFAFFCSSQADIRAALDRCTVDPKAGHGAVLTGDADELRALGCIERDGFLEFDHRGMRFMAETT